MRAKDLLPNTLYEVSGGGGYNAPYPGTEYVFTTDDVTPSAIDGEGREATRTIHNYNDMDTWGSEVPVRKYVSVHAVRWTGASPQSAMQYVDPLDGSPIDMDNPRWPKDYPDYELEWYTVYEPGPDDHFFMEEGTCQMELRHIDSEHFHTKSEVEKLDRLGDDDDLFDSEGMGIVFGYDGEPHSIVRTLEQLTENRLHRFVSRMERENADAEKQRIFGASNKARWEDIDADTLELLDLKALVKKQYGYSRPHGAYATDEDRVEVMLSLDQIEAINALVKESA